MSEIAKAHSSEPRATFVVRLWQYQAERFPLVKHGALIAAFGASAVCLSALLRGAAPNPVAILVAVLVLFGFFVQLRVADEHKDNEDDARFRPERPVPRGLVTLAELRGVAIAVGAAQLALTAWLDWTLIVFVLAVWAYMAVMTKEFFVPKWLKARPIIYMVSHMLIMPLIDLFATACDWHPAGVALHEDFGLTLGAFLLLSLVNGAAIEIARKSWAPETEREGVETYSKLWGAGVAGVVVMAIVLAGFGLAAFINVRSEAGLWVLGGLALVTAWTSWCAIDFAGTPTSKTSKVLETSSGVFVLANYLLLGVIPLLLSLVSA